MKKFRVLVREVHIQPTIIEADSKEEALKKVFDGEGELDTQGFEYSHTLDTDTWTVEEIKE
jgi:hypothetical protein